MIRFRKALFRILSLAVSIYLLFDSFILGTINAFPTILIPLFVLYFSSSDTTIAFLMVTFILASYRSITALIIGYRYGHRYTFWQYLKICLFLPFEIIVFLLLGLLFVTIGTVLYIKNKDSWYSVERVGVNHQSIHLQGKVE